MTELAESDSLLDRLIKSNFDRVSRTAFLSSSSLDVQQEVAPLFMTALDLDDTSSFLFPEIDTSIVQEIPDLFS